MKNEVMSITATELKNNLGHYLEIAEKQEIVVSKNGKQVIRMGPFLEKRLAALRELRGILKGCEGTLEEAKDEYFQKKYDLHY